MSQDTEKLRWPGAGVQGLAWAGNRGVSVPANCEVWLTCLLAVGSTLLLGGVFLPICGRLSACPSRFLSEAPPFFLYPKAVAWVQD